MALSFKQKIMFGFMALGIIPVIIYAGVSTYMNYQAGVATAERSMDTMRSALADRMNQYFETIHAQARTMAASSMVHDARRDFAAAVAEFDPSTVAVDKAKLRGRYVYQQEKTPGSNPSDVDAWVPTNPKTAALQHLYISGNGHPIGEKQKLDAANDGSTYSKLHAKYHPGFRDFVEEFGYYDIFIIDAETGLIVYTDFKEVDFLTSVYDGPLKDSGLSVLARQVLESNDPEKSIMGDFAAYMPSYNDWAAFVGVPIVEDGRTVGAMLLQMPVGKMNAMVSTMKELGDSVEAFIVGSDQRFRTTPLRFPLKIGDKVPTAMEQVIKHEFESKVDGPARWVDDKGEAVTASMGMLKVPSEGGHKAVEGTSEKLLPWAVVVSMTDDEILATVWEEVMIGLAILVACAVAATIVGLYAGRVLVEPVVKLAASFGNSAKQVQDATGQVTDAVGGMIAASEETAAQSKVIRKNSGEAAGYVKSVAQAVGELNISINDISQSIGEANTLIDDAVEKAQKTDDVVRRLGEAAGKITEVVGLINGLAEQTNLLALNAAIEAARAGDAGRGFAVVADEVKKLATHTSEATVEIQDQVQSIQQVAEQSVSALHTVVEAIHRIRDSATTVSAAVEEQSGVAKQIATSVDDAANRVQEVDNNMGGIEQASNDTGVAADQVNGAAQEVKTAFGTLQTEIGGVLTQMGVKV